MNSMSEIYQYNCAEVWLEGSLKENLNQPQPLKIQSGKSIYETLEDLKITFNQPLVAVINGLAADIHTELKPGDVVKIFPLISGG
jgi:molybdopterin converting factor small subunit